MRIKYIVNKDPRVKEFNTLINSKFPQLLTEKRPELFLVAGGDGAMLHAIIMILNCPYLENLNIQFLKNNFEDDVLTIGLC